MSVVVPVTTEPKRAGQLAVRLAASSYPDVEVVLAGSDRRDLDFVARHVPSGPRIVYVDGTPGRILNAGAQNATGELLLFVEPWLEPMDDDWIVALVEHAQRPEVGIVGGKTFYPDGRLRHIGLVVGAHGLAGRPFDGYAGTWAGYFANADAIRNCRAVGRAGLMTRKALFDELAGFDEVLHTDGLEIDYALRVAARGLRTVFTPYARAIEHLAHQEPQPAPRAEDVARLRARWGTALDADPYYNFHFVAEDPDYPIRTDGVRPKP